MQFLPAGFETKARTDVFAVTEDAKGYRHDVRVATIHDQELFDHFLRAMAQDLLEADTLDATFISR